MVKWMPLLQTLVWPLFLAVILLFARRHVLAILEAIQQRIKEGAPFILGPGGLSLGEIEKKIDAKVDAVREFERKASNAEDWYILGELYRLEKRWESAKYSFNAAIKDTPDYIPAQLGLAATYREESKRPELDAEQRKILLNVALELCNKIIKKTDNLAPAYLTRASVLCALNCDHKEVKMDLEKAISLDPEIKKFIPEEGFEVFKNDEWFKRITQ